jgi:hypothetical protein
MPSQPSIPDFTNPPDSIVDPKDVEQLHRTLAVPEDQPFRYQKIEVEKRFEEFDALPNSLNPEMGWFILGLAYCMIRIDRSLMEAYRYSLGHSFVLSTYQVGRPLLAVNGSTAWAENEWSGIIQGVEPTHVQSLIDYLESYQFNRHDTKHCWRIRFKSTTIVDPFASGDRKVRAYIALPQNITQQRGMIVASPALGSAIPMIGMVRTKNVTPHAQ